MCVLLNTPCVTKATSGSIAMSENLSSGLQRLHPYPRHSISEMHSVVSQAPKRSVGGLVKPVCRANQTIQKACHSDGCVIEMDSNSFLVDDHANSNLNLGDRRWLALFFPQENLEVSPKYLLELLEVSNEQSHKLQVVSTSPKIN